MRATSPHSGAGIAAVAIAAAVWSVCALAATDPPVDPPATPPAEAPTSGTPPVTPTELAAPPAKRPSIIKAEPPPRPSEPAPPAAPAASPGDAAAPTEQAEAPPAGPAEVEITLKDKRRIAGVLIEQTPDSIRLAVGGVPTTFQMFSVERVRVLPSWDEQYKALRESIDDADAEGLWRLAEWLRSHRRFDEALIEVERSLRADPANPDARNLRVLIIEQRKLSIAPKAEPVTNHIPERPKEARLPPPAFPLLNEDQINVIRVYEVDLTRPPRMLIDRGVIDDFMDKYAGTRVEGRGTIPQVPEQRAIFVRKPPAEILGYMFDLRAREFYGQVKVLDNPRAMQMFRDNVNRTWLTNSCATTRCHGGEEAGRLWLFDKKPTSDVAAYTNFFILESFRYADGLSLIDYGEPANSPLLQLGLPREQAKYKHPEVGGINRPRWRPVFRGQDDDKFVAAVEWIRAMYPKRTEYPIDYTPPVPRGAPNAPDGARELAPR